MLSIAGFGIKEMDAEFRYVTVRAVGKSSRFTRSMQVPGGDAASPHFRLPQSSERDLRALDVLVSLQIAV